MTTLWLALRQGRAGAARMALVAFASALAMILAIGALAFWNAWGRQEDRTRALLRPFPIPWVDDGHGSRHYAGPLGGPVRYDHTRWFAGPTTIAGREVLTVRVARVGPAAPLPPSLDRLPAPGEVLVSPALSRQFGRVALPEGTRAVGTVPRAMLPEPDGLVIIVGAEARDIPLDNPSVAVLRSFSPASGRPSDGIPGNGDSATRRFNLVAAAVIAMIALLGFISTAGQFAFATRERRAAALALAGATPARVRAVVAAESGIAALVGGIVGVGAAAALLWARSEVAVLGFSAFREDLLVAWWVPPVLVVGTALLAGMSAAQGIRRLSARPIEGRRHGARAIERLPAVGLVVLLVMAFLVVAVFVAAGSALGGALMLVLLLVGYFAVTTVGTGLMLRVAERLRDGCGAAGVIAGARLTAHHGRAMRGFGLAAFCLMPAVVVVCVVAGQESRPGARADLAVFPGQTFSPNGFDGRRTEAELARLPGVVATARISTLNTATGVTVETGDCREVAAARRADVATTCSDVVAGARTNLAVGDPVVVREPQPGLGQGREIARLRVTRRGVDGWGRSDAGDSRVFAPASAALDHVPRELDRIEVAVAGGREAVRRTVAAIVPLLPPGSQVRSHADDAFATSWGWRGRAAFLVGFLIALGGVSVAVVSVEGILERRRQLAALVARGVPAGQLAWVAAIETALPSLVATATAVAAGLAVGIPIGMQGEDGHFALPLGPLALLAGLALAAGALAAGVAALSTAGVARPGDRRLPTARSV